MLYRMAGVTTFLTMAYILAVNANILGGTGMDKGALFPATVIASALATIFMAFYAKLPLAIAPGMGLNAFFAYTICHLMGYSWQFALTATLLEGLLFFLLTVTNLHKKIIAAIPETIKIAISSSIGLYIAFIGLKNSEIIVDNSATLVGMGNLASGPGLLGFIGIVLTSVLLVKNVRGALLIGILATTLVGIPLGVTHMNGIFSVPPNMGPIFMEFEWDNIITIDMFTIVFTLLFVHLFDCIGTVMGVIRDVEHENNNASMSRMKRIFAVSSISTTLGAIMGTSTLVVYVESAAGVKEGGRSGLTAFITGFCFLVSLFFAPFFLAIPSAAMPLLLSWWG